MGFLPRENIGYLDCFYHESSFSFKLAKRLSVSSYLIITQTFQHGCAYQINYGLPGVFFDVLISTTSLPA
jgi:hypothetical protein